MIPMDRVDVDYGHVEAAERPDDDLDADEESKPFVRFTREDRKAKGQGRAFGLDLDRGSWGAAATLEVRSYMLFMSCPA